MKRKKNVGVAAAAGAGLGFAGGTGVAAGKVVGPTIHHLRNAKKLYAPGGARKAAYQRVFQAREAALAKGGAINSIRRMPWKGAAAGAAIFAGVRALRNRKRA